MLKKRSKPLMANYSSLPSPTEKYRKPTSSIFSSPRSFTGFVSKALTDSESVVLSPTSTLDSKHFSALRNPFWSDSNSQKSSKTECKMYRENKLDSRGVGLGIVDALLDEKSDPKQSKPESRMVVFGSQLKIQIPTLPPSVLISPSESPKSPADFGIKTRNSQLGSFSPCFSSCLGKKSPFGSVNSGLENPNLLALGKKSPFGSSNSGIEIPSSPALGKKSPKSPFGSVNSGLENPNSPALEKKSPFGSVNSGLENLNSPRVLSASEMELSEDYTCVISYGPNPRTTHIFDDCIVESCCGVVGFSAALRRENGYSANQTMRFPSDSFLSFCYSCKKSLGQGQDIYMYRGEKAFCSDECRYKEMMLEEEMEKLKPGYVYGAFP